MASDPKNYSTEPLDEMLEDLLSGAFNGQTLNEFHDTVLGNNQTRQKTHTSSQSATYNTIKPTIDAATEAANYDKRYDQVIAYLNNIDYGDYPQEKIDGYQPAIDKYIALVEKYPNDLRPVEEQLTVDIKSGNSAIRKAPDDNYAKGYYEALLMVRKVLRSSKQAKLRELSYKVNRASK